MKITPERTGWTLFAVGVAWVGVVIVQGLLSGFGWTVIPTDFEISGQFGDSFGPLGAFMAAVAAIGAWQAVLDQRAALAKAEEREDSLKQEVLKRDFENTFFNLHRTFERIVEQIDVGRHLWKRTGKDAFSLFVEQVYKARGKTEPNFSTAYEKVFLDHQNDLAHYFRTLFNLVKFVDHSTQPQPYFYVKLVRATLSEPELVMLALNGLYHPEGRSNFKPLIEKYALLNNISEAAKADFDLEDHYDTGAFDLPENGKEHQGA